MTFPTHTNGERRCIINSRFNVILQSRNNTNRYFNFRCIDCTINEDFATLFRIIDHASCMALILVSVLTSSEHHSKAGSNIKIFKAAKIIHKLAAVVT